MVWTVEAIEHLKRLALEGKSASAIAAALGAASRSAVIGKANRIGIKLNGARGPLLSGKRASPNGGYASPPPGVPGRGNGVGWAAIPRPKPAPAAAQATWTVADAELTEMLRVRLDEIREFACRWPIGDPRSGDFVYCGLKRADGRPYCAAHCRMAYRPPKTASPPERRWSRALASPWRPSTGRL